MGQRRASKAAAVINSNVGGNFSNDFAVSKEMKKIGGLLLIIWSITTSGQNIQSKIPDHLENVKTDKHTQIQKRLYLVPPNGFKLFDNGLIKNDSTMIVAFDQIFGNYYENGKNFNKEYFTNKGAKVFDYKELTIGIYPARFISMQTDKKEKKYTIVFGDKTFWVMLTGMYPTDDSKTGDQIKKSMLTVYFDKNPD